MTDDRRALGACVLACAVSAATLAQAGTNWDALKSSDWGSTRSATVQSATGKSEHYVQIAQSSSSGSEIGQAFVKLGMEEKRAACYQEVLAQQLSPEEQQEAAKIVSESTSSDEVRTSVVTAGPTIMGGFSAADVRCPEGMGS